MGVAPCYSWLHKTYGPMAAAYKSGIDLTPFHLVKLMVNQPRYQLGLCLVGLFWRPNLFHQPECLESGLIDTQRSQKDRLSAKHRTWALLLPKHPTLWTLCPWGLHVWLQELFLLSSFSTVTLKKIHTNSKTAARFKQLYQQRMQCWRISLNPASSQAASTPTHFPDPSQYEKELMAAVLWNPTAREILTFLLDYYPSLGPLSSVAHMVLTLLELLKYYGKMKMSSSSVG